ncbi:MAG: hypothetical protein UT48_C0001G0084 [Parcubacteria group bacterium GW2011_GWE2_39_37]|uniref:Uncharacterized protein n=1 Tax=Candidatus Falkowbacteria bacterium GW2011_GWF2_39_8 TaxID=1618642 RepID=A0A0G0T791_9BACT|nr:MAG: hypothetical protein UT48_C0001G0084 [Parcubacteria group bacterium GW2011_GWE2_39_37]KKR33707.1 MAG: hypothetical protein UT64_C0004G0014 [Candidatus Falkowbacteria bacterium GW2011_GWF2_39_8]
MNKKTFLIGAPILLVSFFIGNSSYAQGSRPPSNSCYIKGEVMNFKNVNEGKYNLSLKIIEFDCGVMPTSDSKPLQINEEVVARWFPANATYDKLSYDQQQVYKNKSFTKDVDKNKILINGVTVKAIIDSWDHEISYVNLVQESANNSNKTLDENKIILPNNNNGTVRSKPYLVISLIILLSFISLILLKKNKK